MNTQGRALYILALTQNSFPRAYTKPEEDTRWAEKCRGAAAKRPRFQTPFLLPHRHQVLIVILFSFYLFILIAAHLQAS